MSQALPFGVTAGTEAPAVVTHNAEVSELRGKLAAMEGQLRRFTVTQAVETQSATARKELETAGADATDIKTYTAMAAKDPTAARAFAASVVSFLADQPKAPPVQGTEIPAAPAAYSKNTTKITAWPQRRKPCIWSTPTVSRINARVNIRS